MSRKNPIPDGTPRPAAGNVPDLRAALDVWREDAARTAERLDVTGALADRIVSTAEQGRPLAAVPSGARWYAAAAVLLIAIGVAGTFMARQAGAQDERTRHGGAVRFVDLEEALVQVLADDPKYSPGLEGR